MDTVIAGTNYFKLNRKVPAPKSVPWIEPVMLFSPKLFEAQPKARNQDAVVAHSPDCAAGRKLKSKAVFQEGADGGYITRGGEGAWALTLASPLCMTPFAPPWCCQG
eukprot:1154203-Pelagomonas_calceolata.AAC.5